MHETIDGITYSIDKLPNGYARVSALDVDSGSSIGESVYPDYDAGREDYDAEVASARRDAEGN